MARLESHDNPQIIRALLEGRLMTFSSLAAATSIPTTTLDRRLKSLMRAGIVAYYDLAGSYGLSLWLRSEKLEFKTALEILEQNRQRREPFRVYTIGYEEQTRDTFVETLKEQKIERLVDVREVANSRRAGFSANMLESHMKKSGIEYIHLKGLGSPQDARRKLHIDKDFATFSEKYRAHLEGRKDDLKVLIGLAIEKPTAIMCYEKDASRCHRSIIASRMSSLGFEVRNLS